TGKNRVYSSVAVRASGVAGGTCPRFGPAKGSAAAKAGEVSSGGARSKKPCGRSSVAGPWAGTCGGGSVAVGAGACAAPCWPPPTVRAGDWKSASVVVRRTTAGSGLPRTLLLSTPGKTAAPSVRKGTGDLTPTTTRYGE